MLLLVDVMLTRVRLFHLFVSRFSSFSFLQTLPEEGSAFMDSEVQIYASEDDLDQCLYYLRTLSNMLRWSSDSMWAALAQNTISTDSSHKSLYRISKLAIPE
jgi:hypothetical protein